MDLEPCGVVRSRSLHRTMNWLHPLTKRHRLTWWSKVVFLLWILFIICFCLCLIVMSVSCSLVITCWGRADILTLLYVVFCCVLSPSHRVSCVRCGAWLYRFLIVDLYFYRVHHQRLLKKINQYGVYDSTYQWIASFLSQRTQYFFY